MTPTNNNNTPQEPTLVGMDTCRKIVFSCEITRPSARTFADWKSKGYLPFVRIHGRVFMDPVQVRKAIDKRFTIQAD